MACIPQSRGQAGDGQRLGARETDGRPSVRVVAFFLALLALVAMFGFALLAYGGDGGGEGPPARASDRF